MFLHLFAKIKAHNLKVVGSNPAPATNIVAVSGSPSLAQRLRLSAQFKLHK